VERIVERCRLARSHLAGDQQEGLAILDAIAQVRARFLMLATRVYELELVPGGERVLAQAEVMFEHRSIPRGGTYMWCGSAGLSAGPLWALRPVLLPSGARPPDVAGA